MVPKIRKPRIVSTVTFPAVLTLKAAASYGIIYTGISLKRSLPVATKNSPYGITAKYAQFYKSAKARKYDKEVRKTIMRTT